MTTTLCSSVATKCMPPDITRPLLDLWVKLCSGCLGSVISLVKRFFHTRPIFPAQPHSVQAVTNCSDVISVLVAEPNLFSHWRARSESRVQSAVKQTLSSKSKLTLQDSVLKPTVACRGRTATCGPVLVHHQPHVRPDIRPQHPIMRVTAEDQWCQIHARGGQRERGAQQRCCCF